jgi:hypothetical protein
MIVIKARNVHEALQKGLTKLLIDGICRDSRNGPVIGFTEPVTTVYERPLERVVFWPERDANPFFHFAESLWMLAGRHDVAFMAKYAKQMLSYSNDGETLNGAYGWRWRKHFGFDQLTQIISALRANKDDRRQVLQMWDANDLLNQSLKADVPCNTQAFFSVNFDGCVDMTVCNRSNDLIWGAYGANAVHFSYLHEFIASAVGRPVGRYWQISNNLHAYDNTLLSRVLGIVGQTLVQTYNDLEVSHHPLNVRSMDYSEWLSQCEVFLQDPERMPPGMCLFFRKVARPMLMAHATYKAGGKDPRRFDQAAAVLAGCNDSAWRLAGLQWLERRQKSVAKETEKNDEQA